VSGLSSNAVSVIAAVRKGSVYNLYLDGKLERTINNINTNIQSSIMHVGQQPPGWSESNFNGPIFETQLFMQGLDAGTVASQSLALKEAYANAPDWSAKGKGDFDTGVGNMHGADRTIIMALKWSTWWAGRRQWVMNLGQWGGAAEHWLWNSGNSISFGRWGGGGTINDAPMSGKSVLAMVRKSDQLKLYLDGNLVGTVNNVKEDIQNSMIHIGNQPPGWSESNFNGPIYETQLFTRALDANEVSTRSIALMGQYADMPDFTAIGKGNFDTGVGNLHGRDHTIIMAMRWSSLWEDRRQWLLDFGQWDSGAQHWLWNGDTGPSSSISFGGWAGNTIGEAPMYGNSVIATVRKGNTYNLYLDGKLVRARHSVNLDIRSSAMHIGIQPPGWSESNFNGPIYETQLFVDALDDAKVQQRTTALAAKYENKEGYSNWGYLEPS